MDPLSVNHLIYDADLLDQHKTCKKKQLEFVMYQIARDQFRQIENQEVFRNPNNADIRE